MSVMASTILCNGIIEKFAQWNDKEECELLTACEVS